MAKATLYDLVIGEQRALSELLEEAEGEFTPEIEQLLAELDLKIDDKLESIGLYILSQRATAKMLKEEEARIAARRKTIERGTEGLEAYAERLMLAGGKEKVKTPRVTVAMQLNNPALVVDEAKWGQEELEVLRDLRPDFVRYTPASYAIDKATMLRAMKEDPTLQIDGLSIQRTSSLRVR